MANADPFVSTADIALPRRSSEVVQRTWLCATVAALEGLGAAVIVFGSALAYHVTLLGETVGEFATPFYLAVALLTGAVYAIFAAVACSHFLDRQDAGGTADLRSALYGWTAAVAITLLTAFLVGRVGDFSRVSLTAAYRLGIPLTYGFRVLLRRALDIRIRRGALHFESVSIIGNRADVLNFLVGGDLSGQGHKLADTLYFEDIRGADGALDIAAVSRFAARSLQRGTDHLVFVGSLVALDELDGLIAELKRYALNLLYAPAARSRSLKFLDVVAIGPNNVVRVIRTPLSETAVLLKRAFDVVLSGLGLLVLLPVFALVALAIKLESPGPVIYRQARRGFNGGTVMIWKFRSMRVTESGYRMTQAQKDDPRITRIGRLLRSTSIDELPQLVNVFIGQMSLVGPRPHAVSHDEELSRELASYAHRQRIKPGITGWAQVNGFRGETATRRAIEGRVEHDIYYIDHWSIVLDVWILILTVLSPATRRNAR
jgi:Undecaprenyl-phosphate glucose phosphotransferase